jgi:RNA polymerase sigma factor (TIGR02999 family)
MWKEHDRVFPYAPNAPAFTTTLYIESVGAMEEVTHTVTRLLNEVRDGNEAAMDRLFAAVYDELHDRARAQRRRWKGNNTLNTTALIHEAYLKLVDQDEAEWENRAHFLAVAATAMRHILINYARDQRAQKRGGDQPKFSLEGLRDDLGRVVAVSDERAEALIALDEALRRLEAVSARQSQIVECRFFGGMTIQETATALDVSTATVSRGWAMAKAWLHREMQRDLSE